MGKAAHDEMHKVLNAARERYKTEVTSARQAVLRVEGKSLRANLETGEMSFDDFLEVADYLVIEDAYRRAARALSPDLSKTYSEFLAKREGDTDDLEEESLMDAHTIVAAIGLVPEVKSYLELEAEKLATNWLETFRVNIKSLSDERQEVYREIREMSANPMVIDIARPSSWIQATTIREADGSESPLPYYEKHLLCGENGLFPADFNSWEEAVLQRELNRNNLVAWYRNPARSSQDSLGILYEDGSKVKILRPDFIFFVKQPNGSITADIVDPHGTQLSDSIPRLKGLSRYARAYGDHYRRIDAVAKHNDSFKVLDLKEESVRLAIESSNSIHELYSSGIAIDYV